MAPAASPCLAVGAPPALRQLVHDLLACYGELRRPLMHPLRNADDAADIAQTTFLQAHAHAPAPAAARRRRICRRARR